LSALGRLAPPGLRSALAPWAQRLDRFRPFPIGRPGRAYRGERVAVAGLFQTTSGLGRGAHLLALDLEAQGAQALRVDLTAALGLPIALPRTDTATPAEARRFDATDLVVVQNPPSFRKALWAFDPAWLAGRCLVAHWAWELDRLPGFWRRSADVCDEIWASSAFVAEAARASLPSFDRPIRAVPYPARREPFPPVSPEARRSARAALGLPEEAFVAGYSFAAESGYYRKNPEAAVTAFRAAFPDGPARLLLRCHDLDRFPRERARLAQAIAGDPRISLFDGQTRLRLEPFYAALDVYLAPTRGEGYGLNLMEAAQAGVPVVATGYGLSADILETPGVTAVGYDLAPVDDPQRLYRPARGQLWAEPRQADLVAALRRAALAQA